MQMLEKNVLGWSLINANWRKRYSENMNIVVFSWVNFEVTLIKKKNLNKYREILTTVHVIND